MPKLLLLLLILSVVLTGCSPQEEPRPTTANPAATETVESPAAAPRSWDQIKQSGYLRAVRLQWEDNNALPRQGATSQFHIGLLEAFAREQQIQIQWQSVDNLQQMFDRLGRFETDIIPRHLTVTEQRKQTLAFTLALMEDVEVLVGKAGQAAPDNKDAIHVSVPAKSAYQETLKEHFEHWTVTPLDKGLNADDIADAIVTGQIEYSVLDRQAIKQLQSYRDDIAALKTLPGTRHLAWAVSPTNPSLLAQLNNFIASHHLEQTNQQDRTWDLNRIKQKKQSLRMITRNSPETYFLWRSELAGFEYELVREFAKRQNLDLEIIVADSYGQMQQWLNQGKGDLIAAGITRTDDRKAEKAFTIRYNRVSELLVAHKNSAPIAEPGNLKGRIITVRRSSAFWATAQKLAEQYQARVVAADEDQSTELLIGAVADKSIDLTIADSNLVNMELGYRDDIHAPLTLNEQVPYAWAVRKNNPQLLNTLNAYIRKEYRGTFYNVIKTRYFGNRKRQKDYRENRITPGSALSDWDDEVKAAAEKHQFDWRLITAQMFQESRFNPDAKSGAGAMGLMQVLPKTAKELGYDDLKDPVQSIQAGVDYLAWTRARFSMEMPVQERLYFALAAYNAGFGHVRDAQKLAAKMGLKPNVWFNNVEKAMLLLQKPKYYRKARFGYCRGSEPVAYVRAIHQRYLGYLDSSN